MIARINDWFEEVKAKRGKRPTAFQFLQEIKPNHRQPFRIKL
jgi:DNA-directed RNA polymerase